MISLLTNLLSSDGNTFLKKFLLWASIPLVAWYVSLNWYQLMLIQGNSMAPTYRHLQLVVLDKHSEQYKPGDVIAFYSENLDCVLVKRIIAGPEDTAQITGGTLQVNGQISQTYPNVGLIASAGILAEPVSLGQGEFLVLGDSLEKSVDSSNPQVGRVSENDILGKICLPQ